MKNKLFNADNKNTLLQPISRFNPVTVQVLGVCSALAVTTQLKTSLVMGLGVIAVTAFSSGIISLIREYIPNKIRIIVEMTVVATMVILVDQILKAYAFDVSKQLSIFVGLIITNCLVLGRLEAFALGNPPLPSVLDGIGSGIGYALVLAVVGAARELFGSGSLLGARIIPESFYSAGYVNNGFMLVPAGAFVLLGVIIWIQRAITGYREE
jgi:Na+-transporting NADH:ubiquinone oxidoreductase subunit D